MIGIRPSYTYILNIAARVVLLKHKSEHVTSQLKIIQWLPSQIKSKSQNIYSDLQGQYLILSPTSLPPTHAISSLTTLLLPSPSRSVSAAQASLLFLKHANHNLPQDFSLAVPSAWNAFPPDTIGLLRHLLQDQCHLLREIFPDQPTQNGNTTSSCVLTKV